MTRCKRSGSMDSNRDRLISTPTPRCASDSTNACRWWRSTGRSAFADESTSGCCAGCCASEPAAADRAIRSVACAGRPRGGDPHLASDRRVHAAPHASQWPQNWWRPTPTKPPTRRMTRLPRVPQATKAGRPTPAKCRRRLSRCPSPRRRSAPSGRVGEPDGGLPEGSFGAGTPAGGAMRRFSAGQIPANQARSATAARRGTYRGVGSR